MITRFFPVMPGTAYATLRPTRVMLQAHQIAGDEYVLSCLSHREGTILMLDNGVIETGSPQTHVLLEVAEKVRPNYIVCPDLLRDGPGTRELLVGCGPVLEAYADQLIIVPQSEYVEDWWVEAVVTIRLAHQTLRKPFILGVPGILDEMEPNGRCRALEHLPDNLRPPIHLLGIRTTITELFLCILHAGPILSVDSTLPMALALDGQELSTSSAKVTMKNEDWKLDGDVCWMLIQKNIEQMGGYLRQWSLSRPNQSTATSVPTETVS